MNNYSKNSIDHHSRKPVDDSPATLSFLYMSLLKLFNSIDWAELTIARWCVDKFKKKKIHLSAPLEWLISIRSCVLLRLLVQTIRLVLLEDICLQRAQRHRSAHMNWWVFCLSLRLITGSPRRLSMWSVIVLIGHSRHCLSAIDTAWIIHYLQSLCKGDQVPVDSSNTLFVRPHIQIMEYFIFAHHQSPVLGW